MSFDLKLSNGDIVFSPEGDVEIVEGLDKLKQDVLKILITELGSNVYHPWYGSELSDDVVGNTTDARVTAASAESAISNALENLAALQVEQQAFQRVTPQEMIAAISNIKVEQEPADFRIWNVLVSVVSKSLNEVTENFSINP